MAQLKQAKFRSVEVIASKLPKAGLTAPPSILARADEAACEVADQAVADYRASK